MNDTERDSYVILAVCIATVAIFTVAFNAFKTIRDFDLGTTLTLSVVGSVFSQTSLALAMVCAVIIGRHMLASRNVAPTASVSARGASTVDASTVGLSTMDPVSDANDDLA